jgi:hypothetical protein
MSNEIRYLDDSNCESNCGCTKIKGCANGIPYLEIITSVNNVISINFINLNTGTQSSTPPLNYVTGDCKTCKTGYRIVQNLIAGNNVINHNLNLSNVPVIVETRDNVTGQVIDIRVITETSNNVTIFTTVPYNNVRISIYPLYQ